MLRLIRVSHEAQSYCCVSDVVDHFFLSFGGYQNQTTVLTGKSDSDVMFYLQRYQGLGIDRSLVYQSYPHDRIDAQVICRFALALEDVHVNVLLNSCTQNITSLSLLVDKTNMYCTFSVHSSMLIDTFTYMKFRGDILNWFYVTEPT